MTSWAPSDVAHERNRFAVRAPPWTLWSSLAVPALVAEALALRPVLFDRAAPIQGLDVVFSLIGGSSVAFGLIAWHRRPDSRSAMLTAATGLRGPADRVEALDGRLRVVSPPGKGTVVSGELPCAS